MNIFLKTTFFLFISAVGITNAQRPETNIIPAPNELNKRAGNFIFSNKTKIIADNKEKATEFLLSYLKSNLGYTSKIIQPTKKIIDAGNVVVIEKSMLGELPTEGYELRVSEKKIVIRGRGAGLLYGVYSFIQLFPSAKENFYQLPCLEIKDAPRFAHRGMMLDVARHFFNVREVKKLIDLMAFYKLNTFHWHLTDNEGWRIEIKKYPKLTTEGGFRNNQIMFGRRELLDTAAYGGFYTQNDIREVVRYASERFITIIPEIDIPAHSYAALRAYPQLKCKVPAKSSDPGAYDIIFNPSEETFGFLEDVFTEVASLFPGQYIHIGGDEANKIPWQESAFTQQLMKEKNLKDVHSLQSYFVQRVEKFLNSIGKQIIGWDEILEGGLAPNATVMSWRGEEGGIESVKMKHKVIMTPLNKGLYFDFGQSMSGQEPFNIGGYASLNKAYSYDPIPKILTDDQKKYVIGVQANLWTEFVGTAAKVEYMLFPRLLALSEISWTQLSKKNYNQFSNVALPAHLARLEKNGVNFRVPEPFVAIDTTMIGERFNIKLKVPLPGAIVYYTLNGLTPGPLDYKYTQPLSFIVPANETREIKAVAITATGKRSLISTLVMHNRQPANAVAVQEPIQGLKYQLFGGGFNTVDKMEEAKILEKGVVRNLSLTRFKEKNDVFGVIYDGYIRVDSTGVYNFSVLADDGMKLFINDELVVDNDLKHAAVERSGSIPLMSGFHNIKIKYFDAGDAGVLNVSVRLNNGSMKPLDVNQIFYKKD